MVAMNHNFVSYIHWVRNFLVADLKKHLSACGMCPKIARAALPCQASILGGGKAKDLVDKVLLPGNMDSIIINTMPKSGSVYINAVLQAGLGLSPVQIHNMALRQIEWVGGRMLWSSRALNRS